eukprot:g8077.t1
MAAVVTSTSSGEEDDRAPLLVLHNASNGRAWFRADGQRWAGWGLQYPLIQWSGVAVKGGRTVGLNLYLCNLMGFIAPEIGNLSLLVKLDLGHNKLFGSIPPELGRLKALKTLDLYHNQLSGPIPTELGELSELLELNVGTNKLTGTIPTALGKLRSLELLRLTDNLLSGPIPVEISQLKLLKVLKLNGNQLDGEIPPELGNLSALVSLWLNDNQLEGTIPQQLGALTLLESLWLKHNKGLKFVPVVTKMQLGRKMKGPCDIRFAAQVTCLDLTDSANQCNADAEGTAGYMDLTFCSITDDDVEEGHLAACFDAVGRENITILAIHDNELTTLPSDIFDGFMELSRLYANGNELAILPSGIFDSPMALLSL